MPLDASSVTTAIEGGVRVAVKAKPHASRERIVGIVDDGHDGAALEVAVRAKPVEGEANAALIAVLAELFRVRKRDVALLTGKTGRNKLFDVRGVDLVAARALLDAELLR